LWRQNDTRERVTPYLNTLPGRLLRSVHVDERVMYLFIFCSYFYMGWSQWPHGLSHGAAAARLLGLWVLILP